MVTRDAAIALAEEFQGYPSEEMIEVIVERKLPKDLAGLGILVELQVFSDESESAYIPIRFAPEEPDPEDEDNVLLAGSKNQLYFLAGNQDYEAELQGFLLKAGWDEDAAAVALLKDKVVLGPCKAVAYWKAKHHLDGEPKKAITRQHEFGRDAEGNEVGELPTLVYNQRDQEFELVGGSYTVEPEGISG